MARWIGTLQGKRKIALLCALLVVASSGCWWSTQFPNMRRQFDALSIPESYTLQSERQEGRGPTFYGRPPSISRTYRSNLDPQATCDELIAVFGERSPTIYQRETICTLGFRIPAGWRGKLSGVWRYTAMVWVGPGPAAADPGSAADHQQPDTRIGVSVRQE